jgi:hypothetical protein
MPTYEKLAAFQRAANTVSVNASESVPHRKLVPVVGAIRENQLMAGTVPQKCRQIRGLALTRRGRLFAASSGLDGSQI